MRTLNQRTGRQTAKYVIPAPSTEALPKRNPVTAAGIGPIDGLRSATCMGPVERQGPSLGTWCV